MMMISHLMTAKAAESMSNGPTPIGSVALLDTVQLSDVSAGQASDFDVRRSVSDAMDMAVKSAMRMPSADIDPKLPPNAVMSDPSTNSMVRDRSGQMADGYETQMDAITDRFVTLYQDMTIFKVTWQIAKRTGRDIETLLKAQ